jgi:2'-5' RNA ligase
MGSDANGGQHRAPADERLNVFAVVTYVPGRLGAFLDDLRRELVPQYNPHAHVSVLPPRPLAVDWHEAGGQARVLLEARSPFEIELGAVRTFPVTDVIYIELGRGASELSSLHAAMNSGALEFCEPFPYHPHITLAQEIPHDDVPAVRELARRRWAEFRGPRSFRAERAVFVQNTLSDCWIDLAEYSLGAVPVR